jgi:hypothetical protein
MKVSRLIELLQTQNKPDDEIMFLCWEKHNFDYSDDDELKLTDEAWLEISNEFDLWDEAGISTGIWIADAVSEYAEMKEGKQ